MVIANDGTGTDSRANYTYRIFGKKRLLKNGKGEIKNYPRNAYSPWELVRRILNQ